MRYNYCTLFDSGYLSRGLLLYDSLMKYSDDAWLYVFAFDDESFRILKKMNLPRMTVVSLKKFEDSELLRVKPTRSRAEYCWTSSSSTVLYVLNNFDVSNCTYVDADMIFYSDPSILIKEMGDNSVSIIKHRYTKKYDQSKLSGIYCVQFMTFKKEKQGLKILNWWRDRCLEWCYNRREDGKFGDQKYLDDWPKRFEGIHTIENLGAGVAPWNVQQYKIFKRGRELFGNINGGNIKLIFYHYHALKYFSKDKVYLGGYGLKKAEKELIYAPIIKKLCSINRLLEKKFGMKSREIIINPGIKDRIVWIVKRVLHHKNMVRY
jgi:hypothetical protein